MSANNETKTVLPQSFRIRSIVFGPGPGRVGRGDAELCESSETSHAADDVSGSGLQFPGAPLRMEMHHLSYYCVSVGGRVLFLGFFDVAAAIRQ